MALDTKDQIELDELIAQGRATWPGVEVAPERFRRFVLERSGSSSGPRAVELYLACACLDGDQRAIARLQAEFLAELPEVLERANFPSPVAQDAAGVVCERLLLGSPDDADARPRLMEYSGHGDLRSWLRVVATRTALDILRKQRREVVMPTSLAEVLPVDADSPELAHLKQMYREEFRVAFEEALTTLSRRERNLLRNHLLGGLTIDDIGSIYRVHRGTAARWLDAARARLAGEVHTRMMARIQADRGDVESILRLIRSQLDISLRSTLGEHEE